jgi:predicted phage tail protein
VKNFWEQIPPAVRTVLNVVAGAAVAAGVQFVAASLGHSLDVNGLWQAIAVAAATAFVRAINPADSAYGVGSASSIPGGV